MSPIPYRIVTKAWSGQFVDMRDFLSDNVALFHQLEAFGMQSAVRRSEATAKGSLHFLYCFLAYITAGPGIMHRLLFCDAQIPTKESLGVAASSQTEHLNIHYPELSPEAVCNSEHTVLLSDQASA